MTRTQLEAVHSALTDLIDSWNDAAADEDRGKANDALCITLFDDGSGSIGRRQFLLVEGVEDWHDFKDADELLAVLRDSEGVEIEPETPIDVILHCPQCGTQHVDAPEPASGWTNPAHRSHLCHNCKAVWRPADVPTNGVRKVNTRGERDTV